MATVIDKHDIPPLAIPRYKWLSTARPDQITPTGDWSTWLLLAGRGFGKTRTAAEDVGWYGLTHPGARIAVVAETFADGRDTCIEGEAGLIACLPDDAVQYWNRSLGELILINGSRYKLYSGDKPDQARGHAHDRAWFDELAKMMYAQDAWDQVSLGLRRGSSQSIVTTTPRPIPIIKQLFGDEKTHTTVGTTYDNLENLSDRFRATIVSRYEGTRLGRQELHAHILDDVPGALWSRKMIEDAFVKPEEFNHALLKRIVVAIDPAMTSGEDADETGIVVAGVGSDGRGYVLGDSSGHYTPDGWARAAIQLYADYKADRIVAEVNNGGEMVGYTIRTVAPFASYRSVHASRGKRVRAEPVAALYEQGRVSHVGSFPMMEDQMCTFVPDEVNFSPDRVDALVWCLTELMLHGKGTRRMVVHR